MSAWHVIPLSDLLLFFPVPESSCGNIFVQTRLRVCDGDLAPDIYPPPPPSTRESMQRVFSLLFVIQISEFGRVT